jgi:hypothetical protein
MTSSQGRKKKAVGDFSGNPVWPFWALSDADRSAVLRESQASGADRILDCLVSLRHAPHVEVLEAADLHEAGPRRTHGKLHLVYTRRQCDLIHAGWIASWHLEPECTKKLATQARSLLREADCSPLTAYVPNDVSQKDARDFVEEATAHFCKSFGEGTLKDLSRLNAALRLKKSSRKDDPLIRFVALGLIAASSRAMVPMQIHIDGAKVQDATLDQLRTLASNRGWAEIVVLAQLIGSANSAADLADRCQGRRGHEAILATAEARREDSNEGALRAREGKREVDDDRAVWIITTYAKERCRLPPAARENQLARESVARLWSPYAERQGIKSPIELKSDTIRDVLKRHGIPHSGILDQAALQSASDAFLRSRHAQPGNAKRKTGSLTNA